MDLRFGGIAVGLPRSAPLLSPYYNSHLLAKVRTNGELEDPMDSTYEYLRVGRHKEWTCERLV